MRQRTAESTAARRQAGTPDLVDLCFADDLPGYVRDGYENGRLPVLALARKLGIGNSRIKQELDAAVVVHRRPGEAGPARARWASGRAAEKPATRR